MSKLQSIVKVGIADVKTVKAPDKIRTSGLGSCVGVILYDLDKQVAGLAHIMLPNSRLAKQANKNVYKYADTAIDILIEMLHSVGARKYALKAKLAGGAQMFEFESAHDLIRIGPKNVQAVREKLHDYHITPEAMDVGGNCGRTIEFDPAAGTLKVRTIHKGESII
ncbi:chemotaxis protein CheD [Lentibacillus halodurans]|uniref:Probable chemoreceptor glutamine deamidase CheD n=1 Tax=Lentibacillus halodurans TaxID=237679 RepID=A0A1I0VML3_9BACI|nr:chemotaxis protein CheD [Lentibacillus halodurans]SFA77233.1 chemotaxis protein CheD [Lentibacillus halodurans]